MEDKPLSEEASTPPEATVSSKDKTLQLGLILLGKVVGGLLFAGGLLLVVEPVLISRIEGRMTPDLLPIAIAAPWLLVTGICLWIRAGHSAFGFWRGVCTLIGASWVSGSVVALLAPVVLDMYGLMPRQSALPQGLIWSSIILGLVLGIPLLIFGFRPKKGFRKSVKKVNMVIDSGIPVFCAGIIGFFGFCIRLGIPFGLIAIIVGHVSLRRIKRSGKPGWPKNLTIVGIILGYVGLILGCILMVAFR